MNGLSSQVQFDLGRSVRYRYCNGGNDQSINQHYGNKTKITIEGIYIHRTGGLYTMFRALCYSDYTVADPETLERGGQKHAI